MIKYHKMSLDANMVHRELQRFIKLDEAYQAVFLKQQSGFNEIQSGHFNASMIRLGRPVNF